MWTLQNLTKEKTLGTVITWANVDLNLSHHMALLGHNELNICFISNNCSHGGYHDRGLRALMIVSRLCYIATLKHDLLCVCYKNAIMNIYTFME